MMMMIIIIIIIILLLFMLDKKNKSHATNLQQNQKLYTTSFQQ